NRAGRRILIDAPPITGDFDWAPSPWIVIAVGVASVVVIGAHGIRSTRWAGMLMLATGLAAAWAVSLALLDGPAGLTDPVLENHEYIHDVSAVGAVGDFLAGFTDRIAGYGVHVQGHPPGMVLGLWGLDGLGLGGTGWAAALFVAGGVVAVPAALIAAREVAGEAAARQAAPFLILAPVAIWVASSADALYAGVGAWAVTLVVLATGRARARSDVLALAGGLLFGVLCFLSYGLVLLAAIPLTVAWRRRRLRPVALAMIGALPIFVMFLGAGFWWIDGLLATKDRYFAGVGSRRPYVVFLIANLAAFAVALGPAIAVALSRLHDARLWLLVGGALTAVALADLSGMSKGEVERIWVPFTPWVLLAGAALVSRAPMSAAPWLGLQAGAAVLVATLIRTPW
ncbi:MAG: hypothetical protein ACRDWD_06290, partial [Acidimicrobiia bacterium]